MFIKSDRNPHSTLLLSACTFAHGDQTTSVDVWLYVPVEMVKIVALTEVFVINSTSTVKSFVRLEINTNITSWSNCDKPK